MPLSLTRFHISNSKDMTKFIHGSLFISLKNELLVKGFGMGYVIDIGSGVGYNITYEIGAGFIHEGNGDHIRVIWVYILFIEDMWAGLLGQSKETVYRSTMCTVEDPDHDGTKSKGAVRSTIFAGCIGNIGDDSMGCSKSKPFEVPRDVEIG